MKKALTNQQGFYAKKDSNKGHLQRKEEHHKERKEQKTTLSQWYGMKKIVKTPEIEQELELLRYRNFLNKDTAHQVPQKTGTQTEFMEFGYFAGTGKKKRQQYKSFADEWISENPDLQDIVEKRMKLNVKKHAKDKLRRQKSARKADSAAKKGSKAPSKRKRANDM